ncbi:MAG TPA: hypothetical protein VFR05_02440, partial [Terriglobia bacterium]|nr:hypothetical protein [Terriglobia bacterium]
MTDHAVGLQVSSAMLGVIVMASLAGLLGQYIGLNTIPVRHALAITLILLRGAEEKAAKPTTRNLPGIYKSYSRRCGSIGLGSTDRLWCWTG